MTSAQEAIEALCRLSAPDREWILRALSPDARGRLRELTAVTRDRDPAPSAEPNPREPPQALLDAPAALVVSRLCSEPAWILALVLTLGPWPWQEALLAALPPERRQEAAQLRARLPRMSNAMHESLLRALCTQVSAAAAEPEGPPFEQAFVRARISTRRWSRDRGGAR